MDYYNDNELFVCEWLRNLIDVGHLPPGDVDDRSIHDVRPQDLDGYRRCHFFAGIGGWALALQIAGWPDDRPVWTGSCPCQPFSVAGKRKAEEDERHLWPVWRNLIAECRPATIFGEQVSGTDGCRWLAGVRIDLEGMGYRVGAADLCAASVAAPHIRQRLWWVAYTEDTNRGWATTEKNTRRRNKEAGGSGRRVGNTDRQRRNREPVRLFQRRPRQAGVETPWTGRRVGNAHEEGRPWETFELVGCADERQRRIEPGTPPLAHGIPQRVGRLRAYGNAIVPHVAAEFIRAYMETR